MAKFIMIFVLAGMVTFGVSNLTMNSALNGGTNNSVYKFGFNRAHDIASSITDVLLMRIANDPAYRVGTPVTEELFSGEASYIVEDTFFEGDSLIEIRVDANFNGISKTIVTYAELKNEGWVPPIVRGAWTVDANLNKTISDMFIDGRNHDLSLNIIPTTGISGVSTSTEFTNLENAAIGGTHNGIDYPMTCPEAPEVIEENYNWEGGFPQSPDEMLGYPEGTLKAVAQSGEFGSQYLLNPAEVEISGRKYIDGLTYPLSGVTYIEVTNGIEYELRLEQNGNSGILVVHNSDRTSRLKGLKYDAGTSDGLLTGLLITDYSFHHHLDILGGVVQLSPNLEESKSCNGNADHWVYYSSEAIMNATEITAEISGELGNLGYGFGKKRARIRYVRE
jgi:hypothetical protein